MSEYPRKAQNIEVPESMQSLFMKTVRPMFKANLKKVQDDHTSGVPTFKSVRKAQKKSALDTTTMMSISGSNSFTSSNKLF